METGKIKQRSKPSIANLVAIQVALVGLYQRWKSESSSLSLPSGNLTVCYWKYLNMTIYSGFSHWTWWFSIAMLVYQRVTLVKVLITKVVHFKTVLGQDPQPHRAEPPPRALEIPVDVKTQWKPNEHILFSSVFICFHLFSSVFICFHLFSSVFICFHLFSSVF